MPHYTAGSLALECLLFKQSRCFFSGMAVSQFRTNVLPLYENVRAISKSFGDARLLLSRQPYVSTTVDTLHND